MNAPRCVWMDCAAEPGELGLCADHEAEVMEGARRSPSASVRRAARPRERRLALDGPHPARCICLDCAPVPSTPRPDQRPLYEIPEGWRSPDA